MVQKSRSLIRRRGLGQLRIEEHNLNESQVAEEVLPFHYGKVSMGGATFRILNFASHFIRVQIFQIDFPLILSASKYFR